MWFLLKKIYRDQSLLRILMNLGFRRFALSGFVVDVGGGRDPDYFDYFNTKDVQRIEALDGSMSRIDFEADTLPYALESVDTVVCANVLEHIYNYRHLVREMHRVLKPGGTLVGFVPFLIQYHPDPHDYFRYTSEALGKIFAEAGFRDISIKEVGGGPLYVNFNTIMLSMPPLLRAIIFPPYWLFDKLFLRLRPAARTRYPLGFTFSMRK